MKSHWQMLWYQKLTVKISYECFTNCRSGNFFFGVNFLKCLKYFNIFRWNCNSDDFINIIIIIGAMRSWNVRYQMDYLQQIIYLSIEKSEVETWSIRWTIYNKLSIRALGNQIISWNAKYQMDNLQPIICWSIVEMRRWNVKYGMDNLQPIICWNLGKWKIGMWSIKWTIPNQLSFMEIVIHVRFCAMLVFLVCSNGVAVKWHSYLKNIECKIIKF